MPYVLTWGLSDGLMSATIQISGENIPIPKPLPKAPRLKVIADWKPSFTMLQSLGGLPEPTGRARAEYCVCKIYMPEVRRAF